VLALLAACSEVSETDPGPTSSFYRPMGIGVHGGNLLVASSNFDLRYDDETGGSVIAVDPSVDPAAWRGGLNIKSFAAEMAIADPADPRGARHQCDIADPLALVPVRGGDTLYRIKIGAGGALSCGDGCELSLAGRDFTDPFAVGVGCDRLSGFARAYVGYLRSVGAAAWITQIDLTQPDSADGAVQHAAFGSGQMRAFAFDPDRRRLYVAQTTTGASTVIRYIDLAGGCRFDAAMADGGCRTGVAALWRGIEPRGIALSRADGPDPFRRIYVSARVFDPVAAAAVGVRVGEVGGILLVADLVDDLAGQTQIQVVKVVEALGYGAGALALLPGRGTGLRDVVAMLAGDSGELLFFDDETDDRVYVGADPDTGHPLVGAAPFGLAVDPVPSAGFAHVYVGSFLESFVTRIDVPLADINALVVPPPDPGFRRIAGGTP
jgi:hypothetical protein